MADQNSIMYLYHDLIKDSFVIEYLVFYCVMDAGPTIPFNT